MSASPMFDFSAMAGRGTTSDRRRDSPLPFERPGSSNGSVLIVDDIEANLLVLEAVLEPLRCNVVRATSGEEAMRQLLFREFAVVLMDVMMPGLDGLATSDIIRSRTATRDVPIIFLTGMDFEAKIVAQAYARGAVDFLIKPFDPYILRSKVSVFIELFSKNQQLRAQTALAQQREKEALESRRLYEAERGARSEAEAIARAREEALAIVSHDLRNPMNAISMSASLLERGLAHSETTGAIGYVQTIQRGVARMDSLISDLLDAARVQAGNLPVQLREEDAIAVVNQAVDVIRPILAHRQQTLELVLPEHPERVTCDKERIFQVLSNLLGNASKFSPEGSTITLQVHPRASEIAVVVVDRGCGISPEQLPHIFEPYWQASQERRKGLGLGLAIAKGIVEAHGGRIWAESGPGGGAQFSFTLPAKSADDTVR